MSATCPSCGREQAQGLLCHEEVSRLEVELRAVPDLVEDLSIAISKQARLTTGGRSSKGSVHERWAIDVEASAHAFDLTAALAYWASVIAYSSEPNNAPRRDIATSLGAASYLLDHINEIRKHDRVTELVVRIETETERCRENILGPRERTRIPVGPCPELNEDGSYCDGQVIAYIPRQDGKPSRMQCKLDSEHKWTSIQFYRAGRRIHGRAEQLRRGA